MSAGFKHWSEQAAALQDDFKRSEKVKLNEIMEVLADLKEGRHQTKCSPFDDLRKT